MAVVEAPTQVSALDLTRFFKPRGIVVIGASADARRPGARLLKKLRETLEPDGCQVFGVNPKADRTVTPNIYRSLADVPLPIDVAVIATSDVESAVKDCGHQSIPFALIFAAGFGETGRVGRRREAMLARIAAKAGVRIIGPNTNVNFYERFHTFPGPKIALVTQSGHQGRVIVSYQDVGYAFGQWAPTGNELDVEAADFITYFASEPEVGAIACYIEGWKDGAKLRNAAIRALEAEVPIVVVKVGRTSRGRSFAQSHTAHLTGSDAVFDAFCDQFAVIRVDDLDEVALICGLFTLLPRNVGCRLGVYSLSGGTAAHFADLAERGALAVPTLSKPTQERLKALLPTYLRVDNPVDNGGAVILGGENREVLETMARDPNIDIIVCPIVEALPGQNAVLTQDLVAVREATGRPVIAIWRSPTQDVSYHYLVSKRVPIFPSVASFVDCFGRYQKWRVTSAERNRAPTPYIGSTSSPKAKLGPGTQLNEVEAKRLLSSFGLNGPQEQLCHRVTDAVAFARRIGYPVAMKCVSRHVAHKSDVGLVALGISNSAALGRAWKALRANLEKAVSDVPFEGILVSQQVDVELEMMIGITRDDQFGPVIVVGSGGLAAEVDPDIQMAVLPLLPGRATLLVDRLRCSPLLKGFRGRRPRDRNALVAAVEAMAEIAATHGDQIRELEVNPLAILPEGRGAVVLDAFCVMEPSAS